MVYAASATGFTQQGSAGEAGEPERKLFCAHVVSCGAGRHETDSDTRDHRRTNQEHVQADVLGVSRNHEQHRGEGAQSRRDEAH